MAGYKLCRTVTEAASYESLNIGDTIQTLGFASQDDGGKAVYTVRERDAIYSDPNYIGAHRGFNKGHTLNEIVSYKFNLYTCSITHGDHVPFDITATSVFLEITFNGALLAYDSGKDYALNAEFNKDGKSYRCLQAIWGRHKKYTSWDSNRNTDRRYSFIQTSAQRTGVNIRFTLLREKALIEDGKTIIRIGSTNKVLQLVGEFIDIRQLGAVPNIQFRINKNKGYFTAPTEGLTDHSPIIQTAIDYASTFGIRQVLIDGGYFCAGTIDIFGNVSMKMSVNSGLHTYSSSVFIMIFNQYAVDHSLNVYNINSYQWVPTAARPLPAVIVKGDTTNLSAVIYALNESDIYADVTKCESGAYLNAGGFDNVSAGIVLYNCRQIDLTCEIEKFNENLLGFGYGDGCVDNTVRIRRIFNGRYSIATRSENGGWCNQNIFRSGAIRLDGQQNRDYTIECETVILYVEGDSNIFDAINLEGNSNAQMLIKSMSTDNVFRNLRYEGARAGHIYFGPNGKRNHIMGGYGLSGPTASSKSVVIGPGNQLAQDNGEDLYGPILVGPGRIDTSLQLSAGGFSLFGNTGEGDGTPSLYNTLVIKSQNTNPAFGELATFGGSPLVPYNGAFIVDANGNPKYYGTAGKSIIKTFSDKGILFDLDADGGYEAGRWVTTGYQSVYGGSTYVCLRLGQLSGDQAADFADGSFWIINPVASKTDPLVDFDNLPPYFRPLIIGPKNGGQCLLWDQVVRYSKATAVTGTEVNFKTIGQSYIRVDPALHEQVMTFAGTWSIDDEVTLHNISITSKSFKVNHGDPFYLPGAAAVTINPGGQVTFKKVSYDGGSRIFVTSMITY